MSRPWLIRTRRALALPALALCARSTRQCCGAGQAWQHGECQRGRAARNVHAAT